MLTYFEFKTVVRRPGKVGVGQVRVEGFRLIEVQVRFGVQCETIENASLEAKAKTAPIKIACRFPRLVIFETMVITLQSPGKNKFPY